MFDFFSSVAGYISVFFDYFLSLINSFAQAVVLLASAVSLPQSIVGYMPGVVGASMLCIVSVGVIKFIIGR